MVSKSAPIMKNFEIFICQVCGQPVYWVSLDGNFKDHTKEELFHSYPGAYVPE
jgi:hypothetical protein